MATLRRYPRRTGWIPGLTLGAVVGAAAWMLSGAPAVGVLFLVVTATALGVTFERLLSRRPLTAPERGLAGLLLVAGIVFGALSLLYVALLA